MTRVLSFEPKRGFGDMTEVRSSSDESRGLASTWVVIHESRRGSIHRPIWNNGVSKLINDEKTLKQAHV